MTLRPLIVGLTLVMIAFAPSTRAQVPWRSALASYESSDGPVVEAIDGKEIPDNGWNVRGGHMAEQSAVFMARVPQNAAEWQARLVFMGRATQAYPYCFEMAATRDPNPTLESEWTALYPTQAVAICRTNFQNAASFERSVVRLSAVDPVTTIELRLRSPFPNITGFRINLIPEFAISQASPITRNPNGNCIITEFQMRADPLLSTNIAIGRPVIASSPVTAGLPALHLTDGFDGTSSCADRSLTRGRNPHYEIDLGQVWPIHHLVVKGEALANTGVELRETNQSAPNWSCVLPDTGGTLMIGGRTGDGTVDTGRWVRVGADDGAAHPVFSEVEIYPHLRPFVLSWSADGHSIALRDVPHGARNLHFEISTPAPVPLETIHMIRYRFPGWRDDWQEVDPRGGIRISTPPPGTYRMELEAKHSDGVWDDSGQAFPFTVLPVWWQSGRFISSLGALLALAAYLAWRQLHIRQLARDLTEARHQTELESNRRRIARDMHDDIGARLTHIALLADAAERAAPGIKEIAHEARETVGALDQIVWAINPRDDTVGRFAEYLSIHAAHYIETSGIRLRQKLSITDRDHEMGFETRHSLMMACKEALQNIAKHSGADEARLEITDADHTLTIVLADHGRGLGPVVADVDHSGLDNMRERLAECRGTCRIESPPEGGVRVTFQLPLQTRSNR